MESLSAAMIWYISRLSLCEMIVNEWFYPESDWIEWMIDVIKPMAQWQLFADTAPSQHKEEANWRSDCKERVYAEFEWLVIYKRFKALKAVIVREHL